MANIADPDQMASSEANWSGSTLFAKAGYNPGSTGQGWRQIKLVIVFYQGALTGSKMDLFKFYGKERKELKQN